VTEAWLKVDVMQCGYCRADMIMAATALLAQNPKPSDADIVNAMGGHSLPLRDLSAHQTGDSYRREEVTPCCLRSWKNPQNH